MSSSSRRPRAGLTLFIALTASLLPPILISGAWLSSRDAEEAVERFARQASLLSLGVSDGVHELISLKIEVLNVTAGTLSAVKNWAPQELQALTDAQIQSSGSFDSFYVGDTEGTSLVFAPSVRSDGVVTKAGVNYSDREYFKLLKRSNRPAFGKLKRGKQSGVANVHVAVPIYQDLTLKERGPLRGFITAGLRPVLIEQVVKRILKGSEGLRALVMEADGAVISDSEGHLSALSPRPDVPLYTQSCATSSAELLSAEGQALFEQQGVDEQGRAVHAVCAEINLATQRWQLWITTPQTAINESAQRSITLTLGVAGLLILIVLGVAALLSLILTRLMSVISDNAQRVAEGEFSIELPPLRWYSPRELIEVGEIVVKTLKRLQESDHTVRALVRDLEAANQRQAPLVEAWRQVREIIEIIDLEGRILFANPSFYEHLGVNEMCEVDFSSSPSSKSTYSPLLAHGAARLTGQLSSSHHALSVGEHLLKLATRGEVWVGEVEVMKGMTRRLHEVRSTPIFDDDGRLSQVLIIRRDITDERVAQAAVAHNDRLASIGTLAAGMAHEINNPLMYIKTSLELINEELEEQEAQEALSSSLSEVHEALNDAREGVERVSTIVKSLLSIARSGGERGQLEALQEVKVGEVVESCVRLVKPELGKRVRLNVNVPDTLKVWGRRSELIQVILNLLTNAAQAMPTQKQGVAHQGLIEVSARQGSTSEVLISVQDNAGGIKEDDLTHIFEPFFSSKPVGQGTGLGLSVSRGIIQAHQGSLEVSSTWGEGSTFTITLPTSERAHQEELLAHLSTPPLLTPAPSATPQPTSPPRSLDDELNGDPEHLLSLSSASEPLLTPLLIEEGRALQVLIVDDDLLVARSLAKLLRGEQVELCLSAPQALERLSTQAFDVILSDVMMPEMDGPSFYEALIERQPAYQERFLFITGAAKGDVSEALRATGRLVLNKPLTRDELYSALEALEVVKRRASSQRSSQH